MAITGVAWDVLSLDDHAALHCISGAECGATRLVHWSSAFWIDPAPHAILMNAMHRIHEVRSTIRRRQLTS